MTIYYVLLVGRKPNKLFTAWWNEPDILLLKFSKLLFISPPYVLLMAFRTFLLSTEQFNEGTNKANLQLRTL
jgi:hypothetical protein